MKSIALVAAGSISVLAAFTPVTALAQTAPTQIVYSRSTGDFDVPKKNEIFLMEADGTNEIRLTRNRTEDAYPNLTSDGERIVFSRWIDGQYDLFIMEIATGQKWRFTRSSADEVIAAWSPDDRWLVFTRTFTLEDGTWQSDIFKMRLRDRRSRRITDTPRTKEFAPDWSPDGGSIAFTKQNYKTEKYGIAVTEANGDALRWLVVNPLTEAGYTDANPSWSPDSEWVAFSRDHGDDPYVDIYKVRRDGSDVTPVTELFGLAENPAWGADDRIVFSHNEGVAVVDADGGEIERITPTLTGRPYWWPDW